MAGEISKILEDYGCEEVDRTIARFMGDESFFIRILFDFIKEPGFEELGEALSREDAGASFAAAHMLKGVIANCGITPMLKTIEPVVETLRNGGMDGTCESYERLLKQRDELAGVLAQL